MNNTKSIIIMFLLSLLGVGTISAESVTNYSYTLSGTSGLGTLCFPASVSFSEDVDDEEQLIGFRAFTVSGVKDDVLILSEIAREEEGNFTSIPENTPVIVYWPYKAGETHTIKCGSKGSYTSQDVVTTQGNYLRGTTQSTGHCITDSVGSICYIMQDHSGAVAFYQCSGSYNYKVGQFHCWLDLSSLPKAKASTLNFVIEDNDIATGIDLFDELRAGSDADGLCTEGKASRAGVKDGIYTINGATLTSRGEAVENPVHGQIYIMVMNGRAMKFTIK